MNHRIVLVFLFLLLILVSCRNSSDVGAESVQTDTQTVIETMSNATSAETEEPFHPWDKNQNPALEYIWPYKG